MNQNEKMANNNINDCVDAFCISTNLWGYSESQCRLHTDVTCLGLHTKLYSLFNKWKCVGRWGDVSTEFKFRYLLFQLVVERKWDCVGLQLHKGSSGGGWGYV